jgi:hypothetical protein
MLGFFCKKIHVFFLNFCDGSGTIPLSVEDTKMEFVNAVYYTGLIEKQLKINLVTIVTDRCLKIEMDKKRFTIENNVDLCVIEKTVKKYAEPFHLYKSFAQCIIKGQTQISKEILINFFEENDDFVTMCSSTYEHSYNTKNEQNFKPN